MIKSVTWHRKIYRSLVASTLIAGSLSQLAWPVLAEGTQAGTAISNTATGTYEDPNEPGTTINTTSNTVTITVAEVAGITVQAQLPTDTTPGDAVKVGDVVNYDFVVTNVGNDPTRFRIPNLATVTGPGTAGTLQISTDGGTTFTNISGSEIITGSVNVGESVIVRVPVTVTAGATVGENISVRLGNTPGDAQNQLRVENGGDVYTVDNPDGGATGEVAGVPVNGVREASDTGTSTVGLVEKPLALTRVLKTRGTHNTNSTDDISDDTIDYNLTLEVLSSDPTGNAITPKGLVGTTINLDTGSETRILIADAIPENTELSVAPTPPTNWEVVYSTDDPTTTSALAATWSRTAPGDLSTVRRVGLINTDALPTVGVGSTVTFPLQIAVKDTVTDPSLTIANIGQAFGQSEGVPPVDSDGNGIPDNLVYDDSGDERPNNFNDDGTHPNDSNGDGIPETEPTLDDGYIVDATDLSNTGSDTGNTNTATGPGGEANVFTINEAVAASVLVGPESQPDAIGPTDNNDDFTNKSSLVPAGTLPGTTIDPAPVAFTNTARNTGTDPQDLSIIPTAPATADDLPTDTIVTVTKGSDSRSYVYNGTTFLFDADGDADTTADQSPIDDATEFLTITGVAAGTDTNYGVEVNLPEGTPLSTDINRGFPAPVTVFIDDATAGLQGTEPANTTINRVYTGYLQLVKVTRILKGTGPDVPTEQGDFESTPGVNPGVADVERRPGPGNIIEFQIRYKNISEPNSGVGNVILRADQVVITEDGVSGSNNWAKDNDGNGVIDTSNIVGTASDSSGSGNITFFSGDTATTPAVDQTGTTAATDVSKYINTLTTPVEPGSQFNFTFRRRVN